MPDCRTIVESDKFSRQASELFSAMDLDRLMAAFEMTIAEFPDRGLDTGHPLIRAMVCPKGVHRYVIFYIWDDIEVELLAIYQQS